MTSVEITFDPDGAGHCLYTESIDLTQVGRLDIHRATTIEFDNNSQVWRVKDMAGAVIFSSPSRAECLEWEHRIIGGRH